MVTPRNIFTRLRQSYIIYVFFSLSLGLLIFSNAEPNVCGHCSRLATDTLNSEQVCSNIVVAAEEQNTAVHGHGNHDGSHHGEHIVRCGCDETHAGFCGVTGKEPFSQKKTCQETGRHQQCECKSGDQSYPANCERFQSTPPKRENVSAKSFPLYTSISFIRSTDIKVGLDLVSLRCHSPTTLTSRPTAMSGLGTQELLC